MSWLKSCVLTYCRLNPCPPSPFLFTSALARPMDFRLKGPDSLAHSVYRMMGGTSRPAVVYCSDALANLDSAVTQASVVPARWFHRPVGFAAANEAWARSSHLPRYPMSLAVTHTQRLILCSKILAVFVGTKRRRNCLQHRYLRLPSESPRCFQARTFSSHS